MTAENVVKNLSVAYANRMESTPIVWKDELYDVVSNRMDSLEHTVEIYKSETKEIVSSSSLGIGLISALVINEDIYIVGSVNWSTSAPLKIYKSSDLKNFTEVGSLYPMAGRRLFNSSLIFNNGKFILTVEEDQNNQNGFFPNFYESSDLVHWKKIAELKFTKYIACPTLRYVNGVYYLFYLLNDSNSHVYYTSISRSVDLKDWQQSGRVVVAPGADEGQNASDFDLVEYNSQVIMNFAIGNQDGDRPIWSDIKKAIYDGTLQSFVESFFTSPLI